MARAGQARPGVVGRREGNEGGEPGRPQETRATARVTPAHINLRTNSSHSVGARVVRSGGEGLHGRPRPVSLPHLLQEDDPLPTHGRP